MQTVKVKVVRSLPGRANVGEMIDMDAGEARLQIMAGKVLPAGDDGPETLDNKAITEVSKRDDRNGT